MSTKINVAPTSTEGHFVEGANQVIELDVINETFAVIGSAKLVTKNHTSLDLAEDCLITCQQVYNPFAKVFQKSRD
jgi:hypothetical protein